MSQGQASGWEYSLKNGAFTANPPCHAISSVDVLCQPKESERQGQLGLAEACCGVSV